MMEFVLNERLAAGGFEVARLHGCRILLKDEGLFPWFILVPEVAQGIEDLHQLDEETFAEVMLAVRKVSLFVESHFRPEKLNVACIGNIVRQMHIHVVGRFRDDPAWPHVVWGFEERMKYPQGDAERIAVAAREFLDHR
jgi:diadenosine tetraphosphate (Ap4A) HIT family hydrolase